MINFLLASSLTILDPAAEGGEIENVVVICVDTLRADHLGCYGYERSTSPNIDALAANGKRFERAYAPAPWTLPSVASIMSGLRPEVHRAERFFAPVSPQAQLLADILHDFEVQTAAVVGNYFLQPLFGLDRGFRNYDGGCFVDRTEINSHCLADQAIDWIQTEAGKGFFLYLHFFDPHYNYFEHEGFEFGVADTDLVQSGSDIFALRRHQAAFDAADWKRLHALYDSEIAFTDFHVGRVLDALRERDLFDQTMIILTADHGEALGEHEWIGHTVKVYEETTRIPLIVAGPGIEPSVEHRLVQLHDITPTVLRRFDAKAPSYGLEGTDLLDFTGSSLGGSAMVSVATEKVRMNRSIDEVQRKRVLEKDHWRIHIDFGEDGQRSYRLFKTNEPKGLRKKRPEDFPAKIAMLLEAIEDDYQDRRERWRKAHARRSEVAAQKKALIDWPFKYIVNEDEDTEELYDLVNDPHELTNLLEQKPKRVAALRAQLKERLAKLKQRQLMAPEPISKEDAEANRAQIDALGYATDSN